MLTRPPQCIGSAPDPTPDEHPDDLLTIPEAARRQGVKEVTLRHQIRRGALPARHVVRRDVPASVIDRLSPHAWGHLCACGFIVLVRLGDLDALPGRRAPKT